MRNCDGAEAGTRRRKKRNDDCKYCLRRGLATCVGLCLSFRFSSWFGKQLGPEEMRRQKAKHKKRAVIPPDILAVVQELHEQK